MSLFRVWTERFGDLLVARDSVAEVRQWAIEAFPRERVRITRDEVKLCSGCNSAPCLCPRAVRR